MSVIQNIQCSVLYKLTSLGGLDCWVAEQEGNQSPVLKLPVSWAHFQQACSPPVWPNLRDFRSAYTGQRLLSRALQRQETHSKLTMNMDRCMFTQKSWEDASRQPAWRDQRQKGGDDESEFGPSRWTVKQLSMVTKHKSPFLCRASQKHSTRVKGQEPVSLTLP